MSYNYLPLDRKQLHFYQIKNLLDFDQLVSITFYAHEQIKNCRNYLDNKLIRNDLFEDINAINATKLTAIQIEKLQYDIFCNNAVIEGVEMPKQIVKLMVMLKIKSLSYGQSGIDIETVKRLMEMYNKDVLPVIFIKNEYNDKEVLSQLGLALIGFGTLNYKDEKMPTANVLSLLNWQPLQLKSKEGLALINGNQYTCAYGLFHLKMLEEQLLAVTNNTKITSEVFDKVLSIFMTEVNMVVDSPQIFAEQDTISYMPMPTNQKMLDALQLLRNSINF